MIVKYTINPPKIDVIQYKGDTESLKEIKKFLKDAHWELYKINEKGSLIFERMIVPDVPEKLKIHVDEYVVKTQPHLYAIDDRIPIVKVFKEDLFNELFTPADPRNKISKSRKSKKKKSPLPIDNSEEYARYGEDTSGSSSSKLIDYSTGMDSSSINQRYELARNNGYSWEDAYEFSRHPPR